jgi:hypothetical protein
MRKLLILIGLLLLSVVVAVPATPALAQGSWLCEYDFTEDIQGWTVLNDPFAQPRGVYTPGVGFQETTTPAGETVTAGLLVLGAAVDVTDLSITFDLTAGTSSGVSTIDIGGDDQTNSFATGTHTDTYSGTFDAETIFAFSVHPGGSPGDGSGDVTVTGATLEGTGDSPCETAEYVRPVDASHLDELVENPNALATEADNAVFATSVAPGASVFAAADGVITEMRILDPETDCDVNFNRADIPLYSFPCMLLIPDSSTPYFPDGGRGDTAGANVWLVRLFADDGREFTYFVEAADYYLTEGQEVAAGCILGKTFRIEDGQTPPVYEDEPGLTIVAVRDAGTIIESLDLFSVEPDESTACNVDPENANCMGDVQLNDPAEWESSSGVIWNEPGYTLLGGFDAHLRTTMNLDPLQKPELIVRARATGGGNGNVTLTLGQTTQAMSLSEGAGFTDLIIEGDEHEPDGSFYTVRILNDGTSNIDVQSICVRFTDDGEGNPVENPDRPPPPCIFANNSFNDGTTGWSVSSTEPGPGELRVASGGTWAQNVTVPAGTYDLTVVTAIWHYNSYVPDDQDTDDVDIEYDFGAGAVVLDTHTYGEFAQNNNVVVFSTSLVVASDTTDDFLFELTLNSPPTGVRGLAIRSVCIGDEGSGEGGGENGDGDGIFTPSCGTIAMPTGNDLSTWTSWLWAQLNKFYRCELMVMLNAQYKFFQKIWITTTWSIRWSQAATVKTINWFGRDFVGWLGGHLSNIAIGQVTTITSGEEQCGNVFCLLESFVTGFSDVVTTLLNGIRDIMEDVIGGLFNLLSTALNAIISILQQLLGFILSTLGLIVGIAVDLVGLLIQLASTAAELFQLLIQAVVRLITAWTNAVPADVIPSCDFDQTSARCMFFYIAERTVFTESGTLFMPAAAGGVYLSLFVWVINRLRRALMDLGVLS